MTQPNKQIFSGHRLWRVTFWLLPLVGPILSMGPQGEALMAFVERAGISSPLLAAGDD